MEHTAVAINYNDQVNYLQQVHKEEQLKAKQAEQIRRDKLMGRVTEIPSNTQAHFVYQGRH